MPSKHSEPDIEFSQIRITQLNKVGGDPIKPEYAGKMETPYGLKPFVTDLDCLEDGEDYDAVYEFTEGWRGETVARIRLVFENRTRHTA
ncbi:MAG: hypothetical protein U5J64_09445 [Halobacteriales archaeon]|nr:hypothetical protein [Halobacteriales archaeon]